MPTIVENGNTYLYFLEPIKQYKEKNTQWPYVYVDNNTKLNIPNHVAHHKIM